MLIDAKYAREHRDEIVQAIKSGKIFVYPTDTIYGLGCNATINESVLKIREIKQRRTKPMSVIAPNFKWVESSCHRHAEAEKHLQRLPGPYTLFLRTKTDDCVADEVNPTGDGTLGVRIPEHWFVEFIAEAGVPFITTSVNVSGAPYMTNLDNLDQSIRNNVDYILYEGEINGKESEKIDLTKE